jgi:antirestriction protein ArdC
LAHHSGAESRLNREKGKRFADRAYAFEELIALSGQSAPP